MGEIDFCDDKGEVLMTCRAGDDFEIDVTESKHPIGLNKLEALRLRDCLTAWLDFDATP